MLNKSAMDIYLESHLAEYDRRREESSLGCKDVCPINRNEASSLCSHGTDDGSMVDEYEGDWILAGQPRVYRTPHGDTYYGQERKTV